MAHIHDRIDFAVAVFVVHERKVLLVHHRQLNKWLPLGGHIELDENPESAALREAKEESGLEIELIGERPPTTGCGTRALIAPRFLDIHRISPTHEHICMIYWARPKGVSSHSDDQTAEPVQAHDSYQPRLAGAEHHQIRWCTAGELDTLQPALDAAVKWYCLKAIEEVSNCKWPVPH